MMRLFARTLKFSVFVFLAGLTIAGCVAPNFGSGATTLSGEHGIRVHISPYPIVLGEALAEISLPEQLRDMDPQVQITMLNPNTSTQASVETIDAEAQDDGKFLAVIDLTEGGTWTITVTAHSSESARISDTFQLTVAQPTPTPIPMAANFTLKNLEATDVELNTLRGRPVVLNFWATWCEPCRAEMPMLEAAYAIHKGHGLALLGINSGETADQVRPFVEELGLTFPILLDSDKKVGLSYGAHALPLTVFIAPDGRIVHTHIGQIDQPRLDHYLNQIMGHSGGAEHQHTRPVDNKQPAQP